MSHRKLQSFCLIFGYFAYLLLGALTFQVLERKAFKNRQDAVYRMKKDFLINFTSLSPEEVEAFVESLTEAIRMGIHPVGKDSVDEFTDWDFSNCFLFVGSVVSTIGYGNRSPRTSGGQFFCVVFALFGIPMTIIFLHRVGMILSKLCERLAKWLYKKSGNQVATQRMTLLFFVIMGILMFFCAPAAMFQKTEGWTYSESIYFAFITLSTIGFGDYVVGKQRNVKYFRGYRAMTTIWIIFGLAWVASLFTLLATSVEAPEDNPIEEYLNIGAEAKTDSSGKGPSSKLHPVQGKRGK